MSSLRDAAQAALEALESSRVFVTSREKIKHPEGTEWYDERIAALRAALAQQAEPLNLSDPAVQKRLATQWGYVPAAQAEPVEPVYKVKVTSRWHDTEPLAPAFSLPDGEHLLYTAPPQRTMVPLTEGEIAAMVRAEIEALPSYPSAVEELPCRLARAIEKASWEKNK